MSGSSTAFPLGSYTGDPDGSTPSNEAAFEADYASFAQTMGVAPEYFDTYVDYTQPVSAWVNNASWEAWSDALTPDTASMIPVIALPMYSTAAGSLTPDQQYQAIIAGQDDSVFAGIVAAYAAQGYKNLVIRPGWEMNLQGPTYAGSTAQDQADWVAAFQRIYTVLHAAAAAAGVNVTVVWNPGVTNYSNASATTSLYPGNAYVDAIGADAYSDIHPYNDGDTPPTYHDWATGGEDSTVAQFIADPINREHFWSYPAASEWNLDSSQGHALSLDQIIQFAEQQGKPLAIPETGAGNSDAGADVQDDPQFPQWLSQQLTAAEAAGEKIDFVNIWDSNASGANYEFSNASDGKPLEAAAWAEYFGAGSGISPISATPATGGVATTDRAAADPFSGVAITDPNSGQTETAVVTLSAGANGVLSDPNAASDGGVVSNGTYTVSGTAASVAAALDGLVFTPTTGEVALGQTVTTTISALISDTAGETASISGTVTATAVAAPITISSITSSLAINDQTESLPFAGVVITDPNVGQTETAEVSLSNVANGILFDPNSATDGGYIAYGGSYVVTGTAAAVAAALDGLLFAPTSNEVAAGSTVSTVLTALLTDSDGQTSSMATNAVTTATAAPSSVPGPTTIGSGTDTIGLAISEDAWLGNAQFTVAVDGIQIGGIQNAVAIRGQGQQQVFDVAGNFGGGPHTVTVDFLNDLYGGSSSEDRNLFVDSVSYDGTLLPGSLDLYSSGAQSLTVAMPGPTVIGSGADTIAFDVSEDAYQGNAQFTVSVDGTQIGGLETAMAIHGQGQQQVDVEGNFGAGPHSVTVDLVNAYDGGTPQTDRDLYVGDVSFDGTAVTGGLTLDSSGPQSLTVPIPGPTAIGSGPETIALGISEDAYLGNAQFTVSVDGTQVGGVQTAEAIHGAGQDQVFDVNGDWQQGANTVTVDFLNDLYAGTPQTDRNLYVDGASIGGTTVGGALSLYSSGSQSMAVNIPVPGPTTIGAGGDTIDLKMSEDYFAGNAQFVVSVDGTLIGGTQTALASHALGQEQDFLLEGNFAAGSHTVSIDFLNDYYQGTPQTDRNLYLGSATLDGTTVPGAALNLYSNGTQSFTVMVPSS